MKLGFSYRIALVLALTLVAGTALTSVLSLHKFERVLADLLTSRFELVTNDLRQQIETQMDLGLTLASLENVNDELEVLLRDDEQILSIEVFDESGSVLFSTDPSFIGDLVSEDWVFEWQVNRGKSSWSMLEIDAGVVGVGLQNNLNQDVGAVVLRYSREFLDQSLNQQVERLLFVGGVIAIVMTLLSLLGCAFVLRRYFQDWKIMREALEEIRREKHDGSSLMEAGDRHPEFKAFSAVALDALVSIDSATKDLRSLDEESE